MNTTVRNLGLIAIFFGVVALAMGIVFVQQGYAKEAFLREAMTQEQITLEGVEGIIDTPEEAQIAAAQVAVRRAARQRRVKACRRSVGLAPVARGLARRVHPQLPHVPVRKLAQRPSEVLDSPSVVTRRLGQVSRAALAPPGQVLLRADKEAQTLTHPDSA